MFDFTGKTIVVTGAAGALGFAVARQFARAGGRLVMVDVAAEALAVRARELGGDARTIAVDLLDGARVKAALGALDNVDVLCNIAGGFRMGPPVHETGLDLWRTMMDMNATSLLNVVGATVPAMQKRGSGKIINIGALSALSGKPNMAAYTASKSAVIRLTESLALELRDQGINVNCVLPSIIDTPANRADMPKADFAKWVTPDALADVIMFLASDAARAVHGAAIPVPGLS